jgi:hypothetical protein
MNAPDLTQRPPRSPRVRLGGYALLPRMLDKGRATIAGKMANTIMPVLSISACSSFWESMRTR